MLNAERLSRLKPSAVVVNTSRGAVIDEIALAEALSEGRLFGAGLDVFEDEPYVRPELLEAPHTVLTAHIGSGTMQARRLMQRTAAERLAGWLAQWK